MTKKNGKVPDRRSTDAHTKAVMKEAIKEWLDERFAEFGRWSFWGIAAAALSLIAYFILTTGGWKPPA